MKQLFNLNKNLLVIVVVTVLISSSQTMYSIPSLTGVITGLSQTCAYALLSLGGLPPYQTPPYLLFGGYQGTVVEKPIQIDDVTREKLKAKLAPDIDLAEYNKDIYVTADGLGTNGLYLKTLRVTDNPDEPLRLKKYIKLPVNPLYKKSIDPMSFRSWDIDSDGRVHSSDRLMEWSGAYLTDDELDIFCSYIKRDVRFVKASITNKGLSVLPGILKQLPAVCTLPIYCMDRKLTSGFASSLIKTAISVPTRFVAASGIGITLSVLGAIGGYKMNCYLEELKDTYIDQKDIASFKKHLELTKAHVQQGGKIKYYPEDECRFDEYPRYRAIIDNMQQRSLDRRIKALASKIQHRVSCKMHSK